MRFERDSVVPLGPCSQLETALIQEVAVLQSLGHIFLGDIAEVPVDQRLNLQLKVIGEHVLKLSLPHFFLLKPWVTRYLSNPFLVRIA